MYLKYERKDDKFMSKLKVLILPSWYPDKENPILGIFFKEQAEALNQHIDVAVLSVTPILLNKPYEAIMKRKLEMYVEKELMTFKSNYFNWAPKMPKIRNKIYISKLIQSYQEVVEVFGKPDIIHAHVSYPAGYGAMILSEKFNVPFIVTEHSTVFEKEIMTKYNTYTIEVLKNANFYIAVGSSLKKAIIKAGRKQCQIVPNFCNMEKFDLTNSPLTKKAGVFNLINISIMTEKKGIDILLRALHKTIFEYNYTNIHLHLIGSGPNKKEYENLARELNLINNCTFHGRLNDYELAKYMSLSDALVISSRIETFGVVGIEAMACGIPVIATICGGPEDYIEDGVGILVEKENVDRLSEGIISMIDNYDNYNSSYIKKYVYDNYSSKAVCHHILSIYDDMVNNHNKLKMIL
jgi:glycosyltransferase involved in cell wall biosynthesis